MATQKSEFRCLRLKALNTYDFSTLCSSEFLTSSQLFVRVEWSRLQEEAKSGRQRSEKLPILNVIGFTLLHRRHQVEHPALAKVPYHILAWSKNHGSRSTRVATSK